MRALVLICSVLIATPALAQPDAAEVAYREGRKAYDLGEWDQAIASFKEAYRLRSDPKSLFNIAQSYRRKGDCVEALGFFRTYKRNYPSASNITAVDTLITEVESCAKQQANASTSPSSEPAAPNVVENPPPPSQPAPSTSPTATATSERTPIEAPASGRGTRIAGLAIAGTGIALVATGVIFGVTAAGKSHDVASGGDPSNPPVFDPSVESTGKRYDTIAKVCWGVGGAAIIGGTVVYLLGRRSSSSTQVGIAPSHSGAFVTWGGAL